MKLLLVVLLACNLHAEWDVGPGWDDTTGAWDVMAPTMITPPQDISPPDNDLTLTASTVDSTRIEISWDPGAIDSADAESVGIWFKLTDFPDSNNDPTATRVSGFTLAESLDTVTGLQPGSTYFFIAVVRDTTGNWSDTTGQASDTAITTDTAEVAWWDTSWSRRRVITFDTVQITDTLDSFTVLIKLDTSKIDYSLMQLDGDDIRFIDENDDSILDYEIELWDSGGTSYAWVQIPEILDVTGDSIFMYYGNLSVGDSSDTNGTWDADYAAVWHLDDTTAGGLLLDVTSNNRDGINSGTNDSIGMIANGQVFDGNNADFIHIGDNLGITDFPFQISLWYRYVDSDPSRKGGNDAMVWIGDSSVGDQYNVLEVDNDTTAEMRSVNVSQNNVTGLTKIQDGNWFNVVGQFVSASTGTIYTDGVNEANNSLRSGINPYNNADMGRLGDSSPTMFLHGQLDEVRVSSIIRDSLHVSTQYRSQIDSLLTYGAEETVP